MQKIMPFLWFDKQVEEAASFYTSVFKNSKIGRITRYSEAAPELKGTEMSVTFQLDGQEFIALNGGQHFTFTPAISFFVNCETQAEVDKLWDKLSEGGEEEPCGWLSDKYGISWQIIPSGLINLLYNKDAEKSRQAIDAMLQMKKMDIEKIKQAYEQG